MVRRVPIEVEQTDSPTIIAFDPGGTTGWCVMTVHRDALVDDDYAILENIIHWEQGQINGDEIDQCLLVSEMLELWEAAAILFEDFKLRELAAELSPVRLTAVATFMAQTMFLPARPVFLQMSALAMSTVTDERLRRWQMYRPGEQHARDAERHAITFLRRAKVSLALRQTAWPKIYGERARVGANGAALCPS